MTIDTVFDPPLPSDTRETFNTKAFALVGDLNTWSGEANALASQANTNASTASAAAATATTKAAEASSSAASASSSSSSAQSAFNNFDAKYLGSKSSNPSLNNQGAALQTGSTYFNTTSNHMMVWTGSAWQIAYGDATATSASLVSFTPYGGISATDLQSGLQEIYDEKLNKIIDVQVISSNTAAVAFKTYVLTASLTITLPASPALGDFIGVQNSSSVTSCVIARNGSKIMSLSEDMTVDSANVGFKLVYIDATRGWIIL